MDLVEIAPNGGSPSNAPTLSLKPHTITPFWPTNYTENKKNCVRIWPWLKSSDRVVKSSYSSPFWYDAKHKTVLNLNANVRFSSLYLITHSCDLLMLCAINI